MGNHDDLPYHFDSYTAPEPCVSREELVAFDIAHENSYTQAGPAHVTGITNYVLEILPPLGDSCAVTNATSSATSTPLYSILSKPK